MRDPSVEESPLGRPCDWSYCDWQPIRPHPTAPCKGGCGTQVDAEDGFCNLCRPKAATGPGT